MPLQPIPPPETLQLRIEARSKPIPPPDNPDGTFNISTSFQVQKKYRYKPGEYDRFTSWYTFAQDSEVNARNSYFFNLVQSGTFLDIGALCGAWTLPALARDMEVISVEPDPNWFKMLRENVILNDFEDNWTGHNIGLYDTEIRTDFYDMKDIPLQRLDSLTLPKVDYVKIDVEGAELEVLRGGKEFLKKNKPYMFIECHTIFGVTPVMVRDEVHKLVGPYYWCHMINIGPTLHILAQPMQPV